MGGLAAAGMLAWLLASCSARDAHGPAVQEPDAGGRQAAADNGPGRNRPADSDAGSRDRDAQMSDGGPPGAPSPEAPLPVVTLVLKNDSSSSVYYSFNGCNSDLQSLGPSQPPPPASADEQQFWRGLAAGDGCVCDCADLERDEICTKDKCYLHQVYCVAGGSSREVAPGTQVTSSVALFTTVLDRERECVAKQPYPEGTELTARFCWWSGNPQQDPDSAQSCAEVRFFATDAEVSFSVTDELLMSGPDDAG
jgi:hypothetical protein